MLINIMLLTCCIVEQKISMLYSYSVLDPVYTVPDPHLHDIQLNSFKTSVALRFMLVLQNLIITNHRRSVKSKYDRKLTELDV